MSEETLFAAALAIPSPGERARFLDEKCAGNPGLRREVEELLAAHGGENPLDRPPADLGRTGPYEPSAAHAPGTPKVGDRVGPYRLMELIGEGGFGLVYVAEQSEPVRRKVALKVLKPGMDTKDVVARFEAERQALALMDHPNIAKVLDAGSTPQGRPYFVMELVRGVPVTDYCDSKKLAPRDRLALFVPVCQAVQHAHQKGIIHRDLKPSNVLVTVIDGTPVPKVIDFGVAKAVGQSLTDKTVYTKFAQFLGTPLYMSPEQAELSGVDVDTRTDVYALGVLLYELLTGTTPFDKDRFRTAAFDEIRRIIREEEPPKPSTRLSTADALPSLAATRGTDPGRLAGLVRGELDWIVMRCLEKDRNRRYDSATGLAKDVQRYLSGDAVEACPPTVGYRLRKAYRRNRAAVVVGGGFAAVLVLGVAVSLAYAAAAERAKRDAEAARVEAQQNAERADEHAIAARENEAVARREATAARTEQDRTRRLSYASEMNHARTAAEEYRSIRLRDILDRTTPKPGEPDLRGWEWHYLNNQLHGWESVTTFDLPSDVVGMSTGGLTTPDGTQYVTRGRNTYDTATGKLVRPRSYSSVAKSRLSPCGRFVVGFQLPPARDRDADKPADSPVRLVETATEKPIPVPLPSVPVLLNDTAYGEVWVSRGAERVVLVVNPAAMVRWSAKPADPRRDPFSRIPKAKPETVKTFHVWDRASGAVTTREIPTGPERPNAFVQGISGDGKTAVLVHSKSAIVTRRPAGTSLEFWNIDTDPPRLLQAHEGRVFDPLTTSASGTVLLVGESRGLDLADRPVVGVFDTRTGKRIGRCVLPAGVLFGGFNDTCAVSDDGSKLAVFEASATQGVHVVVGERLAEAVPTDEGSWRTTVLRAPFQEGDSLSGAGANDTVVDLWLSPDGKRLATIENHRTRVGTERLVTKVVTVRRVWNLDRTSEFAATWPPTLTVDGSVCRLQSITGTRWAVYSNSAFNYGPNLPPPADGRLAVYDAETGRVSQTFRGNYRRAFVDPSGTRILFHRFDADPDNLTGSGRTTTVPTMVSMHTLGQPRGDRELFRVEIPKGVSISDAFPYFSADGQWVIGTTYAEAGTNPGSPDTDNRAVVYRVWRAEDGKPAATISVRGTFTFRILSFATPRGTRLILHSVPAPRGPTTDADVHFDTFRCVDPATGRDEWTWTSPVGKPVEWRALGLFGMNGGIVGMYAQNRSRIGFSPHDGSVVVFAGDTGGWVLDGATGKVRRELQVPGKVTQRGGDGGRIAFGPNGWFACDLGGRIAVWDDRNPTPVHLLTGSSRAWGQTLFSADGRRLFTHDTTPLGSDGTGLSRVHVWDLSTGQELITLRSYTPRLGWDLSTVDREGRMRFDGERLLVLTNGGVLGFDGTPRAGATAADRK